MKLDILKVCIITILIGSIISKTITAQKQVSKKLFTPAHQMVLKIENSNILVESIDKIRNCDTCIFKEYKERFGVYSKKLANNYLVDFRILCDSFRPHNIHHVDGKKLLDYYGSGDVNNDEIIDSLDLIEMTSGSQSYRSDINGNGMFSDQNDINLLSDYLNNEIDYLPGHWQRLQTKEERIEWIEKVLILESSLKNIQPSQNINDSLYVALQSFVNFSGIAKIKDLIRYWRENNRKNLIDTTHNSYFNLPVFEIFEPAGDPSGFIVLVEIKALAILVGDDPLDLDNWYMWNYKTNSSITFEDSRFKGNSYVGLGIHYYSYYEGDGYFWTDIIEWTMRNKQQVGLRQYIGFFLRNSPIKAKLKMTAPNDTTITHSNKMWLLSDRYGAPTIYNEPSLGEDFYFSDDSLFSNGEGNDYVGEIILNTTRILADTSYLNSESTLFVIRKKFVTELIEKNTLYHTWLPEGSPTLITIKKDSVYQNITVDLTTGVEDEVIPTVYSLKQNYPNPFNPTTKIKYEIPQSNLVQIVVYDILGRKVTTLVNEQKPAGSYEVEFIASQFSSGVYFYELRAGDFRDVKKLVLLK